MKSFTFRLERVLRWRRAQLDLEQFALGRLVTQCARWDAVLTELESRRSGAETAVRQAPYTQGHELQALARYQERLEREKKSSLERRADCARKMEQQRERVIAARRACRLLEKLRESRHAEWEALVNREFEALAAETYLARWER